MEKYYSYEYIDKNDITEFNGLGKELHTYVIPSKSNVPLNIESFGITNADTNYYIRRNEATYYTFEYVVSGKGTLVYNGVKYSLEENAVYILQPGSSHYYYPNKDNPFIKYWINFDCDYMDILLKSFNINDITVFNNSNCKSIFQKILQIDTISIFNDSIYLNISKYLFDIITTLANNRNLENRKNSLAINIKNRLDNSLFSNIKIEDIVKEFNVSKMQLSRIFKENYNISPYQYLLDSKLDYSKHLLKESNENIKHIALLLGYSDEHYFSNLFKSKVGLSPKEYRKTYTKRNDNKKDEQ